MKTQRFVFVTAVLCAALSVSGCASIARQLSAGKVVFDESLPPEQSTVVVFDDSIHVLEYNGIGVEQSWYRNKKYRVNTVTLPAGETTILFDYYFSITRGNTIFTATEDKIELKFDFEAGKDYTVGAYTRTEGFIIVETEYGIAVWDHATTGKPGGVGRSIKSWKLGTF
jgi:hypothetical protein